MTPKELQERLRSAGAAFKDESVAAKRVLDLSTLRLESACVPEIIAWARAHKPYSVLLDHCSLKDRDAADLLASLAEVKAVRVISLRDNLGGALLGRAAEEVVGSGAVDSLNLLGNAMPESALRLLAETSSSSAQSTLCGVSARVPELVVLNPSASDCALLAAEVKRGEHLRFLCIQGGADLEPFFSRLEPNRSLVSLRLVGLALAAPLGLHVGALQLRTLELGMEREAALSAAATASLVALFHLLETNRSVTSLALENVVFTDDSAVAYSQMVRSNRRLLSIAFFGCSFAGDQLAALCKGIDGNVGIRSVSFSGIGLEASEVTAMRAALKRKVSALSVLVDAEEFLFGPPSEGDLWRVGDLVEAEGSDRRWRGATVMAVQRDGESYHVQFEDGGDDAAVDARCVRRGPRHAHATSLSVASEALQRRWGLGKGELAAAAPIAGKSASLAFSEDADDAAGEFRAGEMVETRFLGDCTWYPAKVMKARAGLLDLRLEDGSSSVEQEVELFLVRKPGSSARPAAHDKGFYARGDYVEARVARGPWRRARVAMDNGDGSYDVRLEDGSDHKGVEGRWLRPLFRCNDAVMVREAGRHREARVEAFEKDGAYTVRFEGGGSEAGVPCRRLCPLSRFPVVEASRRVVAGAALPGKPADSPKSAPPQEKEKERGSPGEGAFEVGDRVEVSQGKRWGAGKVAEAHSDGSYRVRFLDGGEADRVWGKDMREAGRTPSKPVPAPVTEGEAVAPSEPLTVPAAAAAGAKAVVLKGSCVLVRLEEGDRPAEGEEQWVPGEVTKVRFNGTFDVLLDGGALLSRVAPERIEDCASGLRLEPSSRRTVNFAPTEPSSAHEGKAAGAPVEQEKEHEERKKGRKGKRDKRAVADGTRVAVRAEGGWLMGRVGRCTAPGVYDVLLDGGRVASRVPEAGLRELGEREELLFQQSGRTPFAPLVLTPGAQVDVRPRGSADYVPGVVVLAHRGRGYDVQTLTGAYLQNVSAATMREPVRDQFVSLRPEAGAAGGFSARAPQLVASCADTYFGVYHSAAVFANKWTPMVVYASDSRGDAAVNRYAAPGRLPPATELTVAPCSPWVEFSGRGSATLVHGGSTVAAPLFMRLRHGAPPSVRVRVLFYARLLLVGEVSFSVAAHGGDEGGAADAWMDAQAPMFKSTFLCSLDQSEAAEALVEASLAALPGFTVRRADKNPRITASYVRCSEAVQVLLLEGTHVDDDSAAADEVRALRQAMAEDVLATKALLCCSAANEDAAVSALSACSRSVCAFADQSRWMAANGNGDDLGARAVLGCKAVCRALQAVEGAPAPLGMLLLPAGDAFSKKGLARALADSGDADWSLYLMCEDDRPVPADKKTFAHTALSLRRDPALVAEALPLLRATVAMLMCHKLGAALPSPFNVSSLGEHFEFSALVALANYYEYCAAEGRHAGKPRHKRPEMLSPEDEPLVVAVQYLESALVALHQSGIYSAALAVKSRLDAACPSWQKDIQFHAVALEKRVYWVSLAPYEMRWRLLEDALLPHDGTVKGAGSSHFRGTPLGPVREIASHLTGELGVRDSALADDVAQRLAREGFESWADVLRMQDFVGGKNAFEACLKLMADLGIPFAVAGKISAFVQKFA